MKRYIGLMNQETTVKCQFSPNWLVFSVILIKISVSIFVEIKNTKKFVYKCKGWHPFLEDIYEYYSAIRKDEVLRKDDSKIGGSRVHFPLHTGETPTQSTEEQVNSQQHPSVYEHRRPKSIEDTVKTDGKGIASGQKGPWDQHMEQGYCSPRPAPARPAAGLLGDSCVNSSLPCQTRFEQPRERTGCLKLQGGE